MLLYCNRSLIRVVLHFSGSVFWRRENLFVGTLLALVAAALQLLSNMGSALAPKLPHHYGIMVLGSVVGFAVVFRTNLGWQRYWESVTQLHFMYSKWADAYTQMNAFAQVTIDQTLAKGGEGSQQKVRRVRIAIAEMETHFSLLSALAAHRLSHGDTNRMERRADFARWGQQIVLRRDLRIGEDLTGATKLPGFVTVTDAMERSRSQNLFSNWHTSYVLGKSPSSQEIEALEKSTDRVNMAMYWIVHGLAKVSKDIDIAPPIQSRMYQELSNGMLGYNNALKIADVPFPFPYAQLLTMLLIVFSMCLPVYMAVFTDSLLIGPLLTFVMYQGIWGLNEVAKELENPFGEDTNDISLSDFHARFIDVIAEVNRSTAVVDRVNGACEQKAGSVKLAESPRTGHERGCRHAICHERDGLESIPDSGAEHEALKRATCPHGRISLNDLDVSKTGVGQDPSKVVASSTPASADAALAAAAAVAAAAQQQQQQYHVAGMTLPAPPATMTGAPWSGKAGKAGKAGDGAAPGDPPIEKHVLVVEPDSVVLPIQESRVGTLSNEGMWQPLGADRELAVPRLRGSSLAVDAGSPDAAPGHRHLLLEAAGASAHAAAGGDAASAAQSGPRTAGRCSLLSSGSELSAKVDGHLTQIGACMDRHLSEIAKE